MNAAYQPIEARGILRYQEPMARHSSWRAGGSADRFYVPADVEDLVAFVQGLPPDEPLLWVGLGSNLLVRDGGFRGTVICTAGALESCTFVDERRLRLGAGVPCAKVARITAKAGFAGAEFLAGIPGTLGGALAMNAGAFGGQTWDLVIRVETLDRHGRRWLRERDTFEVGYREVGGPKGESFLSADLHLERDHSGQARDRIRTLLVRRADTQPIGQPSCGSVFRNPPGGYAARWIEQAGLKGFRIGGVRVSHKHANFFVNLGQATATDIEGLIAHVRDTVTALYGVRLMPEVKLVGEPLAGGSPEIRGST